MSVVTAEQEYKGFVLKCYDPYGFWKIHREGKPGNIPKEISGFYTSSQNAKEAFDNYFYGKKKEVNKGREVPVKPEDYTHKTPRKTTEE